MSAVPDLKPSICKGLRQGNAVGLRDELGYVPLSQTGAELLFDIFSQRHERGSTIVTSNLESYRLKQSKAPRRCATQPVDKAAPAADPETAEIISAS
jgi:hypothetical protein